jgi:hypothetical protein
MRLTINHSPTLKPEREYISRVLLQEFLGIDYEVRWENRPDICIGGGDGRELILDDSLLRTRGSDWCTAASLPQRPLQRWRPQQAGLVAQYPPLADLPLIWGKPLVTGDFLDWSAERVQIGIDVFGSCFFLLTRYEEVVEPRRDQFGRYLAVDSLAHREGFLDRPIVNDYLELVWLAMQHLWPQLRRRPRSYQVIPTHDVDIPFRVKPWRQCTRTVAGDLVRRHSPRLALRHFGQGARAALGMRHLDEYDTFDWLMRVAERGNRRCAFYFMADGDYPLEHPHLRALLRAVSSRGHEIGIHPLPESRDNPTRLRAECGRLRAVLDQEGLAVDELGGRQHYLSWHAPDTWQAWEDAGLAYDSTVTFPDQAGFRCGCCYSFPVYNLLTRKELRLQERPLLIMECSLFAPGYMGLGHQDAFRYVEQLARRVRDCRGEFRILWHNHWFADGERENRFYESLLDLGN